MMKASSVQSRLRSLAFTVLLAAVAHCVHAQQTPPQNSRGWWYYTGINSDGEYAPDPITACKKNAHNQMGTPLLAMRPESNDGSILGCKYAHFMGSPQDGEWYGSTILKCSPGYFARSPGICIKRDEAPPPPPAPPGGCGGSGSGGGDSGNGGPGSSRGNPVQVASGAKVQTETDLVVGPDESLRVERTYRSLHKNWKGQSAGVGWSFSFDRDFTLSRDVITARVTSVTGSFGDGSVFTFRLQPDGTFRSQYDSGLSLKAQSASYDDWLLTSADGRIEHYKKINDAVRIVSSHRADGTTTTYSYDTQSRLILISDSSGRMVRIGWNGGEVASIDGPNGGVSYEYEQGPVPDQAAIEGMSRLTAVHFHNSTGFTVASRHYQYEDERQRYLLTGITDENGVRFATYAYNASASVVLSEHAGGAYRYTFDYSSDSERRITDPLGTEHILNVSYFADTRGRITDENQPAGTGCSASASKMTYSANGDLTSSVDFNGHKTCFTTDPTRALELRRIAGLPEAMACPTSASDIAVKTARMISTRWHPDWAIKSAVAEAGRITTYVYNGELGADGQVAHCAGDTTLPNGKPIAVLCSQIVQPTTDSNGTQGFAAAKLGTARIWRYMYNGLGQLLTRTGLSDASGNVDSTRLTYYTDTTESHSRGDLASVTDGAGATTQFLEFSKDGLATTIQRPNGQTVRLEYGPRQRLVTRAIEDNSGNSEMTQYQYDDVGQLIRVVAPDGTTMSYTYDAAHRLTDLHDANGGAVHFTLDNMGNVIHQQVRGPGGELVRQSRRLYDPLNRLQHEQSNEQDRGVRYAYDPGGNLTTITDQLGRVTTQVFDSYDRVSAQTLPAARPGTLAPVIGYSYSHRDQLLAVTDPRKLTTRYTIDGFDQRTSIVSPDSGTSTIQFDAAGNPVSRGDGAGRSTEFRFDAAQRPTQIGSSTFEYGKGGSGAIDRMTKMQDESGQTDFSYDGFGRILVKKVTVGTAAAAKTFAVAYSYGSTGKSAGHVTSITYPSGNRVDVGYGRDGRPSSLAVSAPGASPVLILSDAHYRPFDPIHGWTWGNSTASSPNIYERGFDVEGRIARYPLGHSANNGIVRTLQYDRAGRITAIQHTGGPSAAELDQRYEYDDLDRLIGFDGASTSQHFQYDANGNRTQATFGANTYLNKISVSSNRLNSTTGPAPAKQNSFDASGNLTGDGTIKYTYGSNGRVSAVAVHGVTTAYRYNGLGQRVSKSGGPGSTVIYLYDEVGRLLGEYDGAGKASQETVYLGDLPVAVLKIGTNGNSTAAALDINYVYADHLATPRVITRASDNRMVWRWDNADPFGLDQPDENPSHLGVFIFNPRFPGQVFDRETNNNYNYFRDFDPQTGRYIESDPIGLEGGMNTYTFVNGNPLSYIDRLGLAPGDLYRTADEAAVRAIRDINHMSIMAGLEIGGRIYRTPGGSYSYTWPETGTRSHMGRVPPPICKARGSNEGIYHTHGPYSPDHSPDIISAGDQYWADKEQVPAFVGTPSGNVLKYTPNGTAYGGNVIIIGRGIR